MRFFSLSFNPSFEFLIFIYCAFNLKHSLLISTSHPTLKKCFVLMSWVLSFIFWRILIICCSVTQSCPALCDPSSLRAAAHQASLSFTSSWSLLKLMSIESVMPSNHLILCRPLLLLPSVFPSVSLCFKVFFSVCYWFGVSVYFGFLPYLKFFSIIWSCLTIHT